MRDQSPGAALDSENSVRFCLFIKMATSTVVGALACQRNSFLRSFKTTVISCQANKVPETSKDKQNRGKKKVAANEPVYAIELKDTILFPEGGGQPYDTGSIVLPDSSKVLVSKVLRDGITALHITPSPIEPGTDVSLELDWNRRIDHMQQHTGQHLLSAVLDSFNIETLSWSLGEKINYIELPCKVSDEIVTEVSQKVNEYILKGLPIEVVTPDQHGGELDISHIPDDYDLSQGVVRVVKIGELDANPCCGTHLTSTSQIMGITLLHQTNIRGGNSRLHFCCGHRVEKLAAETHAIVRNAGSLLSCQSDEIPSKIELLTANYKKSNSLVSSLLKEIAEVEAKRIYQLLKNGSSTEYAYRGDDNAEYLTLLQKQLLTMMNQDKEAGVDLEKTNTVVFMNGEIGESAKGMVKIIGPQAQTILAELKTRLSKLAGGGKGAMFQGKINGLAKKELDSVTEYLNSLTLNN